MTGISLDYLCRDRAQTVSLEGLTGSVLGIEVDHYLRKLVQQCRSPLLTPWGGTSQTFLKFVSHDLSVLKKLDIRPLYVFAGLQVVVQHDLDPNARLTAHTRALTNLERKRNDETMQTFAALASPSDLAASLKHYLRTEGVDFLVAPYFAGAQLTYMAKCRSIDAIYGSPDTFVFGADRVITDLSFAQILRATFCDKASILSSLQGISEDQFLDAYLFAGNEFCSVVPILEPNPPSEYSAFRMRAAADVVRQNGTGYLALNGNPALEKKPAYLEEWLKARALFKHHPYLNSEGDVVLSRAEKAPSDVARVIGARLPREVYFYISRGIVEPEIINTLLSGVWKETVPLDGGETREYRFLLDGLNDIRVQCMDLLHGSKQLHHYYEKKVIVTERWYQEKHSEEIEKLDSPLYNDLKCWRVNTKVGKSVQPDSQTNLRALLELLRDPEALRSSLRDSQPQMESAKDIFANTLCRVLQLRGYLAPDHSLSDWGKALSNALSSVSDDLLATVVIAVEMLKLRAIKAEDFSTRLMQENPESEPSDAQWKLLGRVAALMPLQQNDAPWQGPIDREALVSFSLARTTARYLAKLFEMCQLSMLLRCDTRRTADLVRELSRMRNPFITDHDAGLSIYTKRYLSLINEKPLNSGNAEVIEALKVVFPTAKNGAADIDKLFALWDALYQAVGGAARTKQMGTVEYKKFERTNQWLSHHRTPRQS